jgi:hypothetical protein
MKVIFLNLENRHRRGHMATEQISHTAPVPGLDRRPYKIRRLYVTLRHEIGT